MSRSRSIWSVIVASIVSVSALVGAQVIVRPPPPRDAPHREPDGRQIPVGTSSISGTVIAADTEWPVAGVRVLIGGRTRCTAVPPGVESETLSLERIVITDASGQFSFPRLPAGVFRISVSSSQDRFLDADYGERRPGGQGQAIQLADGQQIAVKIPVHRGAVITGVVRGPDGEPLRNVPVQALRYDRSSGFKRLEPVSTGQTDDRGVYRLFGLQAGDYVVSATPNLTDAYYRKRKEAEAALIERAIVTARVIRPQAPGKTPTISVQAPSEASTLAGMDAGYLPTYAPSSPAPSEATTITVAGSEERTGVDIHAQFIRAGTIEGVVTTKLDAKVAVELWLINDDPSAPGDDDNQVRMERDGRFTFASVAPGNYTVFAQTTTDQPQPRFVDGVLILTQAVVLTQAQQMWGKAHVTVSRESESSVSVSLQPARSISGTLVFTKEQSLKPWLSVVVDASPSPGQIGFPTELRAPVQPDGRFTISGVPAGLYVLRLIGGDLKSAIVSGQDVLDLPFEFTGDRDVTGAVLTIADRLSELTGTLTDSTGKPALDYTIVVAATDSRYWGAESRRISMTQPDHEGRFAFDALPAGSYFISVVVDPEPGAIYDPEFLRTIARTSIPVTMPEGGKITQNLRVK